MTANQHTGGGATIDLHVYHHHEFPTAATPDPRIDMVLAILHSLQQGNNRMSSELEELRAAVERTTSAIVSAETLITGLSDRLKALPDPSGEIAALTATLDADASGLAAAVLANTPAEGDAGDTGPAPDTDGVPTA